MKKIFLTILLFSSFSVFAQLKNNIVFFTEQGERFTLILNGLKQNESPETNVKVTDLIALSFRIKIIFQDVNLGEIDKNIYINAGTETTYGIKRNNQGKWVLRLVSEVPIAQALPPASGQRVIVYGTPMTTPPNTQVTVTAPATTVTTTQTVTEGAPNANFGVNITDPSTGVNVNMNINTGLPGNVTTSQTTYTTTTTTTGVQGQTPPPVQQQVYVMPGYNGPVGCPWPMSPQDFAQVKSSIASKSFEDSKLTIAKQVISSNCLTCQQVKEIMLLFSFEDTRLELAKFAYGYTFDIGNYYKLNDAFTFESSIEELNHYINAFRR